MIIYLQENYYIARGGDRRNPGGKIANKIGNLKKKKRRADAKEDEYAKTLKRDLPCDVPTNENDQKCIEAYEWLVLNQEPWSTVTDKWPVSISKRNPYLRSHSAVPRLFMLFPHYKHQYGYQLVSF